MRRRSIARPASRLVDAFNEYAPAHPALLQEAIDFADTLARKLRLRAKGTPADRRDAAATPETASVGMTWQDAKQKAEAHCKRNPFPGVNALAGIVGCSPSTMSKAISKSTNLKARKAEHPERAGSLRAATMNDAAMASTAQTRERDPAAAAITDEAFQRMLAAATPAERETLKSMPPAKQAELAAMLDDPDAP